MTLDGDREREAREILESLREPGKRLKALGDEARARGQRLFEGKPVLARLVQLLGGLADGLEPTAAAAAAAAAEPPKAPSYDPERAGGLGGGGLPAATEKPPEPEP
jgi:hypothetical protein